ncbi:bifunctional proline dehydrogenase/L-glutamate gamma-semialdehyde dehydrogenase [Microbacterium sp. M28]|uniref:bifunctional proline dehydrogenase/L-glutamate gamma-semialdehyde dehydrogenase n=1 Tax=Microbacterium sp. M28 TaxID=2962064 RepID=UPI0021F43080|nr:bifunctional proline dehydrogenase/L-glutamate gamma-semialdehyde dehydrogenase [Microbacterium sp. M28]UYO97535.1 bifunctional proline dehydrogenase/L-glutamate gamma-semialdehyde dehydrogenase [Microbacterium sp. M28]
MVVSPVSSDPLAERAVALVRRWVAEAAIVEPHPAAQRLAEVLRDDRGLAFTLGFVDGVLRPESLSAAAAQLRRIAPDVPEFLPWYLRGAVRVGGGIAPVLPAPTVPLARRALREMVGHLIVDARPAKLGAEIGRIRESGATLNINLLGEAVLGEAEAKRRLDGIHDLIRRPDVDYVSVKVSSILSRPDAWSFDEVVDAAAARLLPLYLTALEHGVFINLDMEEYRDLDLTIAVFTRILEEPRLARLEAGIVLQAYLPDSLSALRELTAWAHDRVAHGGARIKVRLVKGANLPMERVDAAMHGWPQAAYDTKLDTDANHLRLLDEALQPGNVAAVRVGVAGHNLFDIAYARLLAGARGLSTPADESDGRAADVEFEMLLGMAEGHRRAVSKDVGPVRLYVPVVHPHEFDVAIGYLARRLEESASAENFLSAAFQLAEDERLFVREQDRFLDALDRSGQPTLRATPRRTQDRRAPVHESIRTVTPAPVIETDLTNIVLGISRGSEDDPFLETAVYSQHETAPDAGGAPGFANTPDTDLSLAANREWARDIRARVGGSTVGIDVVRAAAVADEAEVDAIVAGVRRAGAAWGARPAAERAEALMRAAVALESRRAELIEIAADEAGKVLAEGDIEVSEAVDFARYYGAKARELDAIAGATFVPSRVTVVAPPWNFPLAIPAGGVLAALAAGSGVILKPAPQARRCAAVIAEALWQSGIPRDVLALADVPEGPLGQALIAHPDVDRVILTGSWDTAELFRSWRPDLPLHAETSGKNAIVIASSADVDLAVADLVRSAFFHAGQKCSAASLAILVGPIGRSQRFARQLADATRSLRVGWPAEPRVDVGPVIEPPRGKLAWALSELDQDEHWIVRPAPVPGDTSGRLWSPGIRAGVLPGSRFHREEFFGPVLGVMHAPNLERAIDLQNEVAYGLTAGLHTRDPDDLALWLDRVQAGNLYVNRGITGAIVQRQPFGGWKRSSVGPGAKAGGPNHLIALGSWRASGTGPASSTLHLRGLDSRITDLIESAQPSLDFERFEWLRRAALSDAIAWDREFGQVRDVSRLGVERNLFRYRPVDVSIRATADAGWHELLRVIVAAIRSGAGFFVSTPVGLPAEVRRSLTELGAAVAVESDDEWVQRMSRVSPTELPEAGVPPRPPRVRLVGSRAAVADLHRVLAEAISGDPDVAVYDGEVTGAGRIELLTFLHEQSISITAHRFGQPDDWSAEVI